MMKIPISVVGMLFVLSSANINGNEFDFLINKGERTLDARDVKLYLNTIYDTSGIKILIWNEENIEQGVWQDYLSETDWVLSEGKGEKRVSIKFLREEMSLSKIITHSVILSED